jgi:hypothetical protein
VIITSRKRRVLEKGVLDPVRDFHDFRELFESGSISILSLASKTRSRHP